MASSHSGSTIPSKAEWQRALKSSNVRLQWDPDHDPHGNPLERRAIQLGLRGAMQKPLGKGGRAIVEIEDISGFVDQQRLILESRGEALMTPRETPYPVRDRGRRSANSGDEVP